MRTITSGLSRPTSAYNVAVVIVFSSLEYPRRLYPSSQRLKVSIVCLDILRTPTCARTWKGMVHATMRSSVLGTRFAGTSSVAARPPATLPFDRIGGGFAGRRGGQSRLIPESIKSAEAARVHVATNRAEMKDVPFRTENTRVSAVRQRHGMVSTRLLYETIASGVYVKKASAAHLTVHAEITCRKSGYPANVRCPWFLTIRRSEAPAQARW